MGRARRRRGSNPRLVVSPGNWESAIAGWAQWIDSENEGTRGQQTAFIGTGPPRLRAVLLHFSRARFAGLLSVTLFCAGCNWLSLAANALTYDTLQSGRSGQTLGSLQPPFGSESIDDIAVAGDLLRAGR